MVQASPLIGRDAILDAALRIADEHGPDAVSMYAVARMLHVEPNALHRHVGGTDDLLDGLVEVLLTRYPLMAADGAWEDRIRGVAIAVRETARKHPAVFPLLLTRPVITPAAREVREAIHSALRAAGIPEAAIPSTERLYSSAVLGFLVSEAAGRFRMHAQETIDADFTELLRWVVEMMSGLRNGADPDALSRGQRRYRARPVSPPVR